MDMQSPWEPPWPGPRRAPRDNDPHLRISNAERHEIADALSKHFAEGRLDSEEFDERVGRVMNAKTRGDVAGVLDDLPRLGPPPPPAPRHRPVGQWVLALLLLLFVASIAAVPAHVHVPWLLIGIVGLLVWHRFRRRHYWRRRDLASRPW
ncbi:MAG: DUF1707 domain-containing protein [Actinobacteria bacterium]|nr:MAG: DUF1707 domain-containing protein [Actinomycetota bacterium]